MHPGIEIRLPSNAVQEGKSYVLRLISPDREHSRSVPLKVNQTTRIEAKENFAFLNRSTIIFIQERSEDGAVRDLTSRIRLSVLDPLRNLNVQTLTSTFSPNQASFQKLEEAVLAAQWCIDFPTRKHIQRFTTQISRENLSKLTIFENDSLSRLIDCLGNGVDQCLIIDALIYLRTLVEINAAIQKYPTWHAVSECPSDLVEDFRSIGSKISSMKDLELVRALSIAICDVTEGRPQASLLAADHRANNDGTFNLAETGSRTYGTVPQLFTGLDVQFTDLLGNATSKNQTKVTVLYSGNPDFFRAYLPRIFFFMTVFDEFHYHFALLGPRQECFDFSCEMRQLWDAMCQVKRQDPESRMSISYAEVPRGLPHPVSFFASGRFYFAAQFLSNFPSGLWIQDVDLYPENDFRKYLEPLAGKYDIGISLSGWLQGLVPWKRVLAGNVFLKQSKLAEEFINQTTKYLDHWLVEDGSWMVDQNALAFAVSEVKDLEIFDFMKSRVPMRQSTMANLFESSVGSTYR